LSKQRTDEIVIKSNSMTIVTSRSGCQGHEMKWSETQ